MYKVNDYVLTTEEDPKRSRWLYKSKILKIEGDNISILDMYSYNKKARTVTKEDYTREVNTRNPSVIHKDCILQKVPRNFIFDGFQSTHPEYFL